MQATIHNEFLTLTVDTHGAEAVSLKNAAGEEMLWQADPAIWKRHAPILFPWTGKLVDGTFTAKGKTWKGGQHGFARDLEHTLLRAEGDTIQLELRADDAIKAERFPYDFVLTSTFRPPYPAGDEPRHRGAALRHLVPPGVQCAVRCQAHHLRLRVPF